LLCAQVVKGEEPSEEEESSDEEEEEAQVSAYLHLACLLPLPFCLVSREFNLVLNVTLHATLTSTVSLVANASLDNGLPERAALAPQLL